jgi:hypothetical protein
VATEQLAFGILIVVLTAGLGGYYAWRQLQTLRRLRAAPPFDDDERVFQRNQAWRRLAGAVLMLLFAGLFIGVFFLEGPAAELVRLGGEAREQGEKATLDPVQRDFLRLYGSYVIVLLLIVMGFIGIAGYEFYAIRRYSVHHMRRIQDERRAMIARETARIRRERNGHT